MSQLRRDVEKLKQRIASSHLAASVNGWEVDGGSVTVRVKYDRHFVTCTIFYMSDSEYPSSPLMAMCPDSDKVNSALENFGDCFEEGAPVLEVVIKLLEEVGLDTAPLEPQQASEAASDDEDEDVDSEEDFSDTGQDMAETNNQVGLHFTCAWLEETSQVPAYDPNVSQELLEAVLKKVSTWDRTEGILQLAEDEAVAAVSSRSGSAQALSMEEQLAKKRQIFAPQEAYKMLARELKDMMLEPSNGVAVDAIGTSVWQWDMWLTDFDAATPIAKASCFNSKQ